MDTSFSSHENPRIIFEKGSIAVATDQCDACPSTLPLSLGENALDEFSDYCLAPLSISIDLDKDFRIVCMEGLARPVVLNESGWALSSQFKIPRSLHNPVFNVVTKDFLAQSISAGLLRPDNSAIQIKEQYTTLTSWIHITDRCNLRCSYCYLPHVCEDMSPETGKAVIESIFRSAVLHGYREVKLKYAGGEPLLNFPLILELNALASSLAKRYNVSLDSVVLSNGTLLTPEAACALRNARIRLMISLDGLGDYHDIHRPYAGGRGSFADVSRAVAIALKSGLVPDISITISGQTITGLPELLNWVLERNLPFSLNFCRANQFSLPNADLGLDEEKIISGMLAAYKVIESYLPRRSLLASLVDRANLATPHMRTCGVGQNYMVFDQNGRVAKCQMKICEAITTAWDSDPLSTLQIDQISIQNLTFDEKEECTTCQWRYWCAGGCPLTTYRATGRYDVKSPNCNIYKALFPEALRLEGLRLLKYQDDPEVVMKI